MLEQYGDILIKLVQNFNEENNLNKHGLHIMNRSTFDSFYRTLFRSLALVILLVYIFIVPVRLVYYQDVTSCLHLFLDCKLFERLFRIVSGDFDNLKKKMSCYSSLVPHFALSVVLAELKRFDDARMDCPASKACDRNMI